MAFGTDITGRLLDVERWNSSARSLNAGIIDGKTQLIPLKNVYDGTDIAGFPKTINELELLAVKHPEKMCKILSPLGVIIDHQLTFAVPTPKMVDQIQINGEWPPGFWDNAQDTVQRTKRQLRYAIGLAPGSVP